MENRLKQILSGIFEIPAEEIDDGTSPGNVGLWDSLNHLRLVSEIEKAFGIRIPQKEIRRMATFAIIREIVGQHIEQKAAN
jgi:acyl carrier protein